MINAPSPRPHLLWVPASDQAANNANCQTRPTTGLDMDRSVPKLDEKQQNPAQAGPSANQLTPEEQKEVEALQQRDREVRAHEQTHKAQLGAYAAGGPYYEFQTGPDYKRYAVGGSVAVDTSAESTPERTIQKAQTIKRAATAVSNPSSADKAVAASAQQMEQEARAMLAEERLRERADRLLGAYQKFQTQGAKLASKVDLVV